MGGAQASMSGSGRTVDGERQRSPVSTGAKASESSAGAFPRVKRQRAP